MSDYYLNHKALAIEYWRDMNKALAENEKLRVERDDLRVEVQAAYERGFIEASRAADHAADADLRAANETLRAEVIRLTSEKEQLSAGYQFPVGWERQNGQGFVTLASVEELADAVAAVVKDWRKPYGGHQSKLIAALKKIRPAFVLK